MLYHNLLMMEELITDLDCLNLQAPKIIFNQISIQDFIYHSLMHHYNNITEIPTNAIIECALGYIILPSITLRVFKTALSESDINKIKTKFGDDCIINRNIKIEEMIYDGNCVQTDSNCIEKQYHSYKDFKNPLKQQLDCRISVISLKRPDMQYRKYRYTQTKHQTQIIIKKRIMLHIDYINHNYNYYSVKLFAKSINDIPLLLQVIAKLIS